MSKYSVAAILVVAVCTSAVLSAAVIDDSYRIVVPDDVERGVWKMIYAAGRELSLALKEGAGVDVKVSRRRDHKGGPAIFLGEDAAVAAGVMPEGINGFANMILEKDGNVYLFGRDVQRRPMDSKPSWDQCLLPTVKAVTRFMERFMDVRFLGPGDVGKDIPKISKVEVPAGFSDRHLPPHDYAPGRYDTMLYGYAANCFGPGHYRSYGGHTYPKACPPAKYFKDHPEYFGLVGGRRTCEPKNNPTLCISNPAIEDILVEEMIASMDEGYDTVQLAQQDGTQWCQCEECKLYGGPEADTVGEKLWILHRKVAERVAKLRPGKKVNIISYGPTIQPPKTFRRFPENVMIEMAGPTEEKFRQWRDGGYHVPHGFVTYIYLWGDYKVVGFTAKHSYTYCANFVRMLHRNKVRGIYRCGYGELFGTEGPVYYLFNRLIDDPEADVNAVVQEYCNRAYGPAATPMRRFHDYLDKRLRGVDLIEATRTYTDKGGDLETAAPENPMDILSYIYVPDVLKKLESCLRQGERMAATQKQKTRIALVRAEFEYAKNLGRIATLYSAYRLKPSVESLSALGIEVDARRKIMDGIYGNDRSESALPIRFPGWPEVRYFGREKRGAVKTNGRLAATLGAPLEWNAKQMIEAGFLPGASRAHYDVPSVDASPDFADFDGGLWTNASWSVINGIQAESPRLAARFKVLAGPEALYVAAESELPPSPVIKGVDRDGPCWREENYSVIVSPQDVSTAYYHLIWGAKDGSCYDAARGLHTDPLDPMYGRKDEGWNGDWTARNELKGGKWRTLLTLPYSTFGTSRPSPGDKWGFNIGRDARHTGKRADKIFLLWSPNFECAWSLEDANARGALRFR